MSKKFLSLVMALVMMFAVMAPAFAIAPPEGFHNYTREEKIEWFNENLNPTGKRQNGIQTRAGDWISTGSQTGTIQRNDGGIFLTRLTTQSRWKIDGSGNVTEFEEVSFSVQRGEYVWPQTGNTDVYGYMPHASVARQTYEVDYLDTYSGNTYYHAHVHFMYGAGNFYLDEIKGITEGINK